jgi:hypothetical protein
MRLSQKARKGDTEGTLILHGGLPCFLVMRRAPVLPEFLTAVKVLPIFDLGGGKH